jgi:hypothetical protein
MRRVLVFLAIAAFLAAPASAQQLKLAFQDGRVTLDATSVPVRTILSEWAKLGGTKVVGAERIAGAPLTLSLVDVPEPQALEIILRNAAGYMAAPRASGTGASMYDRILVLATSTPVPAPAPTASRAPAGPGPLAGTQRFIPPRVVPPQQPPEEEPEEEVEPDTPEAQPPRPVFMMPGGAAGGQVPVPFGPGPGDAFPRTVTINPVTGQPQSITINPPPTPQQPTTPGVIGAPRPGMVQPAPTPRPPGQ